MGASQQQWQEASWRAGLNFQLMQSFTTLGDKFRMLFRLNFFRRTQFIPQMFGVQGRMVEGSTICTAALVTGKHFRLTLKCWVGAEVWEETGSVRMIQEPCYPITHIMYHQHLQMVLNPPKMPANVFFWGGGLHSAKPKWDLTHDQTNSRSALLTSNYASKFVPGKEWHFSISL